jgi:tetratricopeptide (TPR) repeat protein
MPPSAARLAAPLRQARHHHSRGQLLHAAESYRQALQSSPSSPEALLGLSLIARQSGQLKPALSMAIAALAVSPVSGQNSAFAWANYGDILLALHHTSHAEAAYRRAIALQPDLTAAHFGLGNILALQDNYPAALASFQTAVRLAPSIAQSHFALAFAHGKLGAHSKAIAAYRRAVTLRPGFASAWLNMGVELVADGRPQLAALCYRQALATQANNDPAGISTQISAHLNFGNLERSNRRYTQALEHYNRALALAGPTGEKTHPRYSEVQVSFAYLHLDQQNLPQAWEALQSAEAADPTHQNAEIPNFRGILLLAEQAAHIASQTTSQSTPTSCDGPSQKLQEAIKAIDAFHQAEALGHNTAASNRGNALLRLGRVLEAQAAHQAALDRNPYHPGARYNLALTQLRLGDFAHGWPNYEIRWSFREVHPRPRRFHQPRWQGESLSEPLSEPLSDSPRLLLYAEQGLGDTIQFCRYLTPVSRRLTAQRLAGSSVHLILEVQPSLTRLLAPFIANLNATPGITAEVIAHGDPLPPFTHHCPLMSLPAIFQTTLDTVPFASLEDGPYLDADPQLTALRASELTAINPARHPAIGLAWAGNPNYRADHERSTRLETFLPLLQIPNIRWVSLQKGESTGQIAKIQQDYPVHPIYDASSQDQDLADTAALIANLDLVITTDTAVAHLAGALGKPLWLLLPWQSDWRWMQETLSTPWYPTARLFRQSSCNNWPELIRRVARELRRQISKPAQEQPHAL